MFMSFFVGAAAANIRYQVSITGSINFSFYAKDRGPIAQNYNVRSENRNVYYEIHSTELGGVCSSDHTSRGVKCKPIHAVEFGLALREQAKKEIVIEPINSVVCRYCNSENIVKV